MKSYINVLQYGNFVHEWYIENGVRDYKRTKFRPVLGYLDDSDDHKWKDVYGRTVKIKRFDTIRDAKNWKKSAEDSMMDVYGDIAFNYQHISFEYPDEVPLQKESMNIYNVDIETFSEDGFPEDKVQQAEFPITTITIQDMNNNEYYVFGYKEDYEHDNGEDVTYGKFDNEADMLEAFVAFVGYKEVDILTGWNIKRFDIPYIINRLSKLFGEKYPEKLSPIGVIFEHMSDGKYGKKEQTYSIKGIQILDYMELFVKRGPRLERYALDFVCQKILGQKKTEYDAPSLAELYKNDFKKFVDYNIQDVKLVYELDKKMKFLDLTFYLAYMAHCNFEDTFGTVKPWDSFLYNFLLHQGIMVPPVRRQTKQTFLGGYVKNPKKDLHRNISMWDILSSYPHQEMVWNLSPDTIIDHDSLPGELQDISQKYGTVEACVDVDKLEEIRESLRKYNVIFTANGTFYDKTKEGFIPKVVKKLFSERLDYKRSAQKLEGEIKELKDEIRRIEEAA
jgi:DNA polymerase elongation subunit (family B)